MFFSQHPQQLEALLQDQPMVVQATLEGEMTAKGMVTSRLPKTVCSRGGRSGLLLTPSSHTKCSLSRYMVHAVSLCASANSQLTVASMQVIGVGAAVLGDMSSRPCWGLYKLDFVFSTIIVSDGQTSCSNRAVA